jgi:hypothetical protein
MADFYELMPDKFWHLNEYHEYYFWTKNKHRWNEIKRLEEYEDFDICLLPFEGSEKTGMEAKIVERHISCPGQPLYFTGNFETLENTDYPVAKEYQFPIISKKLLSLLESVKPFVYETIPVTIFDFLARDPFLPCGILRDEVKRTTDYVYLKVFQFVMMENSRWKPNIFPEFEILEPVEELDPLFRVRQLPQRLFISQEAREAIDRYNIKEKEKTNRIKGFRLCPNQSWDYLDYTG